MVKLLSENIILNAPSSPTTYNVKLVTIPTTIEANSEVLTKEYVTTLSISPKLPDGANISFNLNHLNLSKSSPNEDSSSTKVNSILMVDDVEYKIHPLLNLMIG